MINSRVERNLIDFVATSDRNGRHRAIPEPSKFREYFSRRLSVALILCLHATVNTSADGSFPDSSIWHPERQWRSSPGWTGTPRLPGSLTAKSERLSIGSRFQLPSTTRNDHRADLAACRARLSAGLAAFRPLAPISAQGGCGGSDFVSLERILLSDRTDVDVKPPAILRCSMAEAVARWVRDDLIPAESDLTAPIQTIVNHDSYACRPRNRVFGAILSEHGKGNALDIRALVLANQHIVLPSNLAAPRAFRERMRTSACSRFTTVLGPGSDGYHEAHIHVDLAMHPQNFRLCRWNLGPR